MKVLIVRYNWYQH